MSFDSPNCAGRRVNIALRVRISGIMAQIPVTSKWLSNVNCTAAFSSIYVSYEQTLQRTAGVTKTLWSLTDMVRVIEDWEAARSLKISGETMVG
jgi:hypothetical protein